MRVKLLFEKEAKNILVNATCLTRVLILTVIFQISLVFWYLKLDHEIQVYTFRYISIYLGAHLFLFTPLEVGCNS